MAPSCITYEHVSVASARYPPRTDWIVERCDTVVTDPWPLLFESFHLSVAGRLPGWIWRNSQCLVEDGLTRQHPFLQLTENNIEITCTIFYISDKFSLNDLCSNNTRNSHFMILYCSDYNFIAPHNTKHSRDLPGNWCYSESVNVTCRSSLDRVIILVMFFCRPAIRCFSLSDISILQSRLSTSSPPNGSSFI